MSYDERGELLPELGYIADALGSRRALEIQTFATDGVDPMIDGAQARRTQIIDIAHRRYSILTGSRPTQTRVAS